MARATGLTDRPGNVICSWLLGLCNLGKHSQPIFDICEHFICDYCRFYLWSLFRAAVRPPPPTPSRSPDKAAAPSYSRQKPKTQKRPIALTARASPTKRWLALPACGPVQTLLISTHLQTIHSLVRLGHYQVICTPTNWLWGQLTNLICSESMHTQQDSLGQGWHTQRTRTVARAVLAERALRRQRPGSELLRTLNNYYQF